MKDRNKIIAITTTEEEHKKIKELAKAEGLSISEFVRRQSFIFEEERKK